MAAKDRSLRALFTPSTFLSLAKTKARQCLALNTTLLMSMSSFAQQSSPTPPQADSTSTSQAMAVSNKAAITVPAGTRIALVLTHSILSRSVRRGDDIYAQTTSPVTSGNDVVIPAGTFVQGKVDKLQRKGDRGELYLQSMSIIFPDGYVAPIAGPITLESDEGYALKDPGKGRMITAFALPAAGLGLGALIGHAATSSQGTTITNTLPPSCGVPTPGCTNGSSQSLTIPPDRLKGTAIGSMVGLGVGGIASLVLLTRACNFFLDVGTPVDMVVRQPMSLEQDEVDNAAQQPNQQTDQVQPIAPRPQPSVPTPPDTDPGICYTPGTPGTPDVDIPGTPAIGDSPGTPPIHIPGIPPTPPVAHPCP
ncbi:MAG TPA: hypothetical protein VFA74_13535 [Terriglobales bacterium]|nr:hypothetical protein [Terriglobales bacterium]